MEEPELYNRSDFSEKYDVALNHPRLVKEMLDKIEKHLKDVEGQLQSIREVTERIVLIINHVNQG